MRIAPAIAALLLSTQAYAAPRRTVVASGDCKDAELSGQAKAFQGALASRPGQETLSTSQFSDRLFPQSTRSYEDLQRQLEAARDQFYEGRNARTLQAVDEALQQITRLPVGDTRRKLYVEAQLLHGLNYRALGKPQESDTAFRNVLRLQPEYELDPDYFAPSVRQNFDKLRRELEQTRKVKLSVKSTLPAADVYLDGLKLGQTPLSLDVVPGAYHLTLVKGTTTSFPRHVQVQGTEMPLLVDVAYEGSVSASPFPCLATADGNDERTLNHAVRLGGTLGVEEVIVVRLERPSSGPKWFAATVLNVEGGQKLREGGFKTQGADAPDEALAALVDFVTTGRSPSDLVVMNANGKAPWNSPTGSRHGGASSGGTDPNASHLLSEGDTGNRPASGLRTASYVALGTGVAAFAGAGIVRLLAQKDMNALEKRLDNGRILSTDKEALALRSALAQKSNVLNGLLIGGGAAVATGAMLYLLAPDSRTAPPIAVGLSASGSGAAASVSGTF